MSMTDSPASVLPQPDDERDLEQRPRPFRALYEHWEANQWSPLDLVLDEDAESFRALGEEEREGFLWIFAHRFHAEFAVATVLAPFVMHAPDYEAQVCLSTQLADEFRHMQCVLRVYEEVFGIRGLEQARAVADTHIDPVAEALYARFDHFVKPLETAPSPDAFLRAVVAYHVIGEGVVARTAQNLAGDQYARYGSFPGLAMGRRLVARDEARHIGIGVSYVRERMAADRHNTTEVVDEVVAEFGAFAAQLLETALAGGMDSRVLAGYGTDARGFYEEAMRLWQIRLRSMGYLDD
jgi:ribonucleotide reductase beta subunit family protein with ferritin-like domain